VEVAPRLIGGAMGPVRAFLKLLSETYTYYEVATKAADIINQKRVVVPAYLIPVAEFEAEVAKMSTFVDDLIIDLREPVRDPISKALDSIWGDPESDMISKTMALVNLKLKGVRVIPTYSQDDLLSQVDYTVIPTVSDWNGLSKAKGLVVADHQALESSIKAKIPVIVKQKEEGGAPVQSLNCVSIINVEAMGRGVLFATPPLLAALSLLS